MARPVGVGISWLLLLTRFVRPNYRIAIFLTFNIIYPYG
jgi:hypothetical protein